MEESSGCREWLSCRGEWL